MLFGGLFEVTDLIMHSPQIIDQNNILKRRDILYLQEDPCSNEINITGRI